MKVPRVRIGSLMLAVLAVAVCLFVLRTLAVWMRTVSFVDVAIVLVVAVQSIMWIGPVLCFVWGIAYLVVKTGEPGPLIPRGGTEATDGTRQEVDP